MQIWVGINNFKFNRTDTKLAIETFVQSRAQVPSRVRPSWNMCVHISNVCVRGCAVAAARQHLHRHGIGQRATHLGAQHALGHGPDGESHADEATNACRRAELSGACRCAELSGGRACCVVLAQLPVGAAQPANDDVSELEGAEVETETVRCCGWLRSVCVCGGGMGVWVCGRTPCLLSLHLVRDAHCTTCAQGESVKRIVYCVQGNQSSYVRWQMPEM